MTATTMPASEVASKSGKAHDELTPAELTDIAAKIQQKARERIQAWLAG